jgi:hypothetical protein
VVAFSNALIAILTLINFGIKSGQIRALINKTQVGLVPGFALASGFTVLQIFSIEISKYILILFFFFLYLPQDRTDFLNFNVRDFYLASKLALKCRL